MDNPILFYDGTCGFCHGAVQLSFRWLKEPSVRFAPLQGETATQAKSDYPQFPSSLESVVLIKENKMYLASEAFFELAKEFRYPYKSLTIFSILPIKLSNFFYGIIAENRYKLFGRKDACDMPDPKMRALFLN
ncbi:MAG: DCC1-like thiol-disulfide oxidoreductase family protein [Chloroherpetonaceae bacterium]|nr:DCC1-like thiol-disulfide oxidoreductase family protein [Chloroherpetonaceae bacterium]